MAGLLHTGPALRRSGVSSLVVLLWLGSGLPPAAGAEAEEDAGLEELSEEERAGLEDADLKTVVIKAKRLEAGEQTTAFGESLQVKEASTRVTTVTEVLSEAVGVQVRRLGGLGSYGAASIRGSTPNQVPVYLDGVLLTGGGTSVVDLGDLAIDTLESIQVYRGHTPVSLGTAGIGGALSLRTRDYEEDRTEMSVSAGSYDTFKLFGLHGHRLPWHDAKVLGAVTLQRSRGDFDYLNWNRTRYNPDDDRIESRSNNDHQALGALVKLDSGLAAWKLTLAEDFHVKEQGVAGIDSEPTQFTSLGTLRNSLTARAVRSLGDEAEIGLDASWLLLEEDFQDTHGAHGELGLGRQRVIARTHAVGLGAVGQALLAEGHLSAVRLQARWERFSHRDRLQEEQSDPKDRLRLALAAQHEWNPIAGLFVLPTLRLETLYGRFGGGPIPGGVGELAASTSTDFTWQASLGLRWEAWPGLTLQANGGRYVRVPDISELFGDRGSVIGNPDLEPEIGLNADAGVIWLIAKRGWLDLLRLEAVWFGTWSDDLIVQVQNSQSTVRSENVDAAEILGAETSLRLEAWDLVNLSVNYTYLHAINRSSAPYYAGKRLPGRPVHELFARLSIAHQAVRWGAKAWFDVDYAGHNYLTPANLQEDALARRLFGAGLRLSHPETGLSVTVEVKNLLDTFVLKDENGIRHPLRDFEAFPLPGRTVMATLHWQH